MFFGDFSSSLKYIIFVIKEYQTNIFFQILEKNSFEFKITVLWLLAFINFNISISTTYFDAFVGDAVISWIISKRSRPSWKLRRNFTFTWFQLSLKVAQKTESYWEGGTQQNPNIKSARFCIVFIQGVFLTGPPDFQYQNEKTCSANEELFYIENFVKN